VRSLGAYALAAAVLVGAGALALASLLGAGARLAVVSAAVVAYVVQVVAFGSLVWLRSRGSGFFVAWGGGMLLRFAVVLVAAYVSTRVPGLPPVPLLLSLVGFLFVLLLLEPVFFRMGKHSR